MDYKIISDKIKSCKTEYDLFEARALINKYRLTSNDAKGYVILHRMHANMSRKLAKAETYVRLNY